MYKMPELFFMYTEFLLYVQRYVSKEKFDQTVYSVNKSIDVEKSSKIWIFKQHFVCLESIIWKAVLKHAWN